MGTLWSDLQDLLRHQVALPEARDVLRRAQQEHSVLRPFRDAETLVGFLQAEDGSETRKDTILATLVRLQKVRWARRLAERLLLLALWPALDGVLGRNRRLFQGREEEVVSSIVANLLVLLEGMDLWRVKRVAATLVRSTEREVRAEALGPDAGDRRSPCVAEPSLQATDPHGPILRWMKRVVPDDATLLFSVIIEGHEVKDVAVGLGISAGAARKRLQRARRRLQAEWSAANGSVRSPYASPLEAR